MMTDENMGERVARAMKERAAQPLKHPAMGGPHGAVMTNRLCDMAFKAGISVVMAGCLFGLLGLFLLFFIESFIILGGGVIMAAIGMLIVVSVTIYEMWTEGVR